MSAITWTPVTYYVAMGVIHLLLILLGFRAMQVDAENNTAVGAFIGAAIIGLLGYFTRDFGVLGVMAFGAISFGTLVAITSGEALKSFGMLCLIIASFAIGGNFFLEPRTPLTLEEVDGMTHVVMTGGLEAEPMTEEESNKLMDTVDKDEK